MRLIERVRIKGFRSIQDQTLASLGTLTALVGKNSSGKSNILRALNLFFNGEVEPGKRLVFSRDHYEQVPPSKKKKQILIEVSFRLPGWFKFRKEFSYLSQIGPNFTIWKKWELNRLRVVEESLGIDHDGNPLDNPGVAARQVLGLMYFRYIPNRSIPSELLRSESQAIANSLFLRMKNQDYATGLLTALNESASRLLRPSSELLESTGAPLSEPKITTADSIDQMLRMTGFQATGPHGGVVFDEDWGSGHQALFLYSVLHSLDTAYSRFFGWRQATIWGVEEPESSLHRDLETNLADRLRHWSQDDSSKIQVIHSTHSPVMTMASDTGYWIEVRDKETAAKLVPIPKLTRDAELQGISGWVHPLLSFPWNPVVLVEGPSDAEILSHVAEVGGFSNIRFLTVPQLDAHEKGTGKDAIVKYLKYHRGLVENRPKGCPLLVLLDWELHDQEFKSARDAYGSGGDRYVLRMDPNLCPASMGDSIKGIERFFPESVIHDAFEAGEVTIGMGKKDGVISISSDQLSKAKGRLRDRVLKISNAESLAALLGVIKTISDALTESTPVQLTLNLGE